MFIEVEAEEWTTRETRGSWNWSGDTYTVTHAGTKKIAVATVNGQKYESLLEAWQNATPNATITLLKDVDMTGYEGMFVPSSTLTLDLKGLEYISSAGLRVLLSAQKRMKKSGSMKLKNVCEEVMEVFEMTGFADILEIE